MKRGMGMWLASLVAVCSLAAQAPRDPNRPNDGGGFDGSPPGNFPGPGGPGGFGPPPMGVKEPRVIVHMFDQDGDKRLNTTERKAAREFLASNPGQNRGPRRFGPRMNENTTPPQPGEKLTPADVKSYAKESLYASNVLRTIFLTFEETDWEKELQDFHGTDVEVAAKLTVDGKTYPGVGVHFRGASSYMMVGMGQKRSLNLTLDFLQDTQRLLGARSLELLNSHEDPSFLRSVLYYQIAGEYIPSPKANFVRVVINGESWGVYVNAQPFNKDFVKEHFGTTKGARWKVPGSPFAKGGLTYLGDDTAEYKKHYEIKSKDDPKAWKDLINLCRVLNQTPPADLEKKLSPLLDLDGALRFLALENVFINNDGYWIRTSDYSLYADEKGRFHIVPHDANETFSKPGGPGFGGGRRGGPGGPGGPGGGDNQPTAQVKGVELDPFSGATDAGKPLLSKLLAVPALRARYAGYVRDLTEKWLDWKKIGPPAEQYHALIAADVRKDTRKLDSTEDFEKSLTTDIAGRGFGPFGGGSIGLKNFVDQRRKFLLEFDPQKRAALER